MYTTADSKFLPLSGLKPGKKGRVVSIAGGRGVREKLMNLGIIPGQEIVILQEGRNTPYLISVHGTRIMIGRGMAGKINISFEDSL